MSAQHNVRASAGDNPGQNTEKGHTPSPRIGIKIPDLAENRTRAVGLEGRDTTEHTTATDATCTLRDIKTSWICIFFFLQSRKKEGRIQVMCSLPPYPLISYLLQPKTAITLPSLLQHKLRIK